MIRRALILLLACLAVTTAQAAGPHGTVVEGQVLRGRFVQERHLQGFAAPLRSEGSFTLAPGRGLIWRMEKPFAVTTVITVGGLVQETGGTETMRLPAARLPFLSRLYDMLEGALAGNWQPLGRDFQVTQTGDEGHWRVELTPRGGEDPVTMPFRSIAAAGSRFVDRVDMTKPGGDYDRLVFQDQVLTPGPLAADEATALSAFSR
jgi:hypothetical protein